MTRHNGGFFRLRRNYVSDAQNQANQVVMIGFVLCSGVL